MQDSKTRPVTLGEAVARGSGDLALTEIYLIEYLTHEFQAAVNGCQSPEESKRMIALCNRLIGRKTTSYETGK